MVERRYNGDSEQNQKSKNDIGSFKLDVFSEYGLYPKFPFKMDYFDLDYGSNLHWHEFYEIEFITSGHAIHTFNNNVSEIKRGSMYMITPSDFHSVKLISDRISIVNINFTHDILSLDVIRMLVSNKQLPHFEFSGDEYDEIYHEMTVLWTEYHDYDPNRNLLMIRNALERICLMLIRKFNSLNDTVQNTPVTPIQTALTYIKHNFRKKITLEEIAEISHISPTYFSEYFSTNMNTSFVKYLNRLRVDFAAALLKTTELGVEQISYESGFNSASYFSKAFKQYFGISPEKYRAKNKMPLI